MSNGRLQFEAFILGFVAKSLAGVGEGEGSAAEGQPKDERRIIHRSDPLNVLQRSLQLIQLGVQGWIDVRIAKELVESLTAFLKVCAVRRVIGGDCKFGRLEL